MSFSSGSSSSKVVKICLTLLLAYFITQAKASTCALSGVYSLICNSFAQNVVPQAKKSLLQLLRTSKFPGPIFIPTDSSSGLGLVILQRI
jgi:hypothetical protein